MLTFKKLRWGNAFSYGDNNEIIFNENPLTQIVAKNGHGKSSIAAILEEVCYNKNSKNIKKADIFNRYIKDKFYWIELTFEKDSNEYVIYTRRGSTQSVRLDCNGIDISAHTATNTYKLIEEIMGYDHKTFSQIVYQSSASSLEFLTATDSNRKKFLIDLLNLSKYTEVSEIFKSLVKDITNIITGDKASIATIDSWLAKISKENLDEMELIEVPNSPDELVKEVLTLENKLATIDSDNRAIVQNNKYKEILNSIIVPVGIEKPVDDSSGLIQEIADIKANINILKSNIKAHEHKAGITVCSLCSQPVNNSTSKSIVQDSSVKLKELEDSLVIKNKLLLEINARSAAYKQVLSAQAEWEKYHILYKPEMPTTLGNAKELAEQINVLRAKIKNIEQGIKTAREHNLKASAHNSKVKVLTAQKVEMLGDRAVLSKELSIKEKLLNTRQLLVKTFSTTGLVAYKIECLVKDLEDITNSYLVGMSDGRFQLGFQISSSDKLNVVITDNGQDIDINALSGGELARVNVSTLLGIRKLMQAISNNRTNLLILDETIDNLDIDGKDKLIEILLNEEYLNTFIVSHGFSHPLLCQLSVVKENNISRIDK